MKTVTAAKEKRQEQKAKQELMKQLQAARADDPQSIDDLSNTFKTGMQRIGNLVTKTIESAKTGSHATKFIHDSIKSALTALIKETRASTEKLTSFKELQSEVLEILEDAEDAMAFFFKAANGVRTLLQYLIYC